MTRMVTILICSGFLLAMSPAAAQLPENWTTVDILAVKWMSHGEVSKVEILQHDKFHDAAIVKDGEELEWILTCIQCDQSSQHCTACDPGLRFAIVDLHFVADLDKLTDPYIDVVQGRPEDTEGFPDLERIPERGTKRRQFSGFERYDPERSRGKGVRGQQNVRSIVESLDDASSSEVWKYTIVVEDVGSDCLTFEENEIAVLSDDCCTEGNALCDTWDPHVYTHPVRPK